MFPILINITHAYKNSPNSICTLHCNWRVARIPMDKEV